MLAPPCVSPGLGRGSPLSSPSSTPLFVVVGPGGTNQYLSPLEGACFWLGPGGVWLSLSCITLSDPWLLLGPPAVPALQELCSTLQTLSLSFLTSQSLCITAPGSTASSLGHLHLTPAAYPLPQDKASPPPSTSSLPLAGNAPAQGV